MEQALQEGETVKGATGDNPWVGCVVVCQGNIVGRGATQPPGQPHAEVEAIRKAEEHGFRMEDCEIYVTLEPCSFFGRTPPCADLIVEKKLRKVTVAILDPNPRVNGRGVERIRQAGIPVEVGLLAGQAKDSLASWLAQWAPAN